MTTETTPDAAVGHLVPDGRPDSPLRRKPVSQILREGHLDENADTTEDTGHGLKRSIGTFSLTMIGVGATIGTGIFFVLSEAVPHAGPATIISFILAAIVAGLTALCYAELASMIPVSGSTYSYSYATLGEVVAFGVSACLLLEYGVSSAAVAVGWSQYLNKFLHNVVGWEIPRSLSVSFADSHNPGVINLPALVLVLMCGLLLIIGAKESAVTNAVMVVIKIGVLLMFVAIALTGFKSSNFTPFFTVGDGAWGHASAIATAAGLIFFSYVGLDAVSTAGEEVKEPKKTLPRALIFALLIVTSVYILVTVAGLGAQPWQLFEGQEAGLAQILDNVTGNQIASTILSAGAIISIFSVTLVTIYGQTRILYSIARDGLLPKAFQRVSDRTRTPIVNTVLVSLILAIMAAIIPLSSLWNLVSLGTLVAFTVVSVGVMIMRHTNPNASRGFRIPLYPITPILTIIVCFWLISSLGHETWLAGIVMLAGAMMFYAVYGFSHSQYQRNLGDHNLRPGMLKKAGLISGSISLVLGLFFLLLREHQWTGWFEMQAPPAFDVWVYLTLIIAGVAMILAAVAAWMTKVDADGHSTKSIRPLWMVSYVAILGALIAMAYFIIMRITVGLG